MPIGMSAFRPKADVNDATLDVRFGSILLIKSVEVLIAA